MNSPAAKEYAYGLNFQHEGRKLIKDCLAELGAVEKNDERIVGIVGGGGEFSVTSE
jgi:hypothetical protein